MRNENKDKRISRWSKKWTDTRKRWKVLFAIVLIVGLCIASYHPFMRAYDDYVDLYADPSYNGPDMWPQYTGGIFEFSVDKELPSSRITMIKNSTHRYYTETAHLFTENNMEASIGGKDWWLVEKVHYGPDIYEYIEYYIEWWIVNYTIHVEDDWLIWNGTHWVGGQVEFYEWHDWELVMELSMWEFPFENGLFNEQYNVTLYADWYGFI